MEDNKIKGLNVEWLSKDGTWQPLNPPTAFMRLEEAQLAIGCLKRDGLGDVKFRIVDARDGTPLPSDCQGWIKPDAIPLEE